MTARRSSPASRCSNASAWPGRNVLMPTARWPTPSSAPTFFGSPAASGGTGPARSYVGRVTATGAAATSAFLRGARLDRAGSAGASGGEATAVRAFDLVLGSAGFYVLLFVVGRLVKDHVSFCHRLARGPNIPSQPGRRQHS